MKSKHSGIAPNWFPILLALRGGPRLGREIHKLLYWFGYSISVPLFYSVLSQMGEDGLLLSSEVKGVLEAEVLVQRRYSLSVPGRDKMEEILAFMSGAILTEGELEMSESV